MNNHITVFLIFTLSLGPAVPAQEDFDRGGGIKAVLPGFDVGNVNAGNDIIICKDPWTGASLEEVLAYAHCLVS